MLSPFVTLTHCSTFHSFVILSFDTVSFNVLSFDTPSLHDTIQQSITGIILPSPSTHLDRYTDTIKIYIYKSIQTETWRRNTLEKPKRVKTRYLKDEENDTRQKSKGTPKLYWEWKIYILTYTGNPGNDPEYTNKSLIIPMNICIKYIFISPKRIYFGTMLLENGKKKEISLVSATDRETTPHVCPQNRSITNWVILYLCIYFFTWWIIYNKWWLWFNPIEQMFLNWCSL